MERPLAAELWALGDYAQVAERLRPAALAIAAAAGEGHGRRAIDLATGTGSVALELARQGWAVSAVDACPPLLTTAEATADADDLVVDWRTAHLTELPYDDGVFELAASSFGLIFSPDPDASLAEIHRCLRPASRLLLTAWKWEGYMGRMAAIMAGFLPGPPAGPFAWGHPDEIRQRLAEHFAEVVVEQRTVPWNFSSAHAAVEFYFTTSPPHVAALRAAGDTAADLRCSVQAYLESRAEPDGRIAVAAEYLLVDAQRR